MSIVAERPVEIPVDEQIEMCLTLADMVEIMLGLELYEYQRPLVKEIIVAVLKAEGAELLILQARQSGKTEAVTVATITLSIFFISVLRRHFLCAVFAPAQSQSIQVTRKRYKLRIGSIQKPLEKMGIVSDLDKGYNTGLYLLVDLHSGMTATIRSMSADKSAQVKGETVNLIIFEQVEDADDTKMKEDIFPMQAAIGAPRVLSGTSTSEIRCEYFYDRLTIAGDEAFIVDAIEASKWNPKYALFVEAEKERLGEHSLEFRAAYMLEWGITMHKFIEDRQAFLKLSKEVKPRFGLIKVAGWDPARVTDYSVVTAMEGVEDSTILDWWISQGTNLEEQVDYVIHWCEEREISIIAVDEIGLGQGVCDMLENRLPSHITLLRVNMSAKQQDEMFKLMDREIKTGRFFYPNKPSRERDLFLQQMLRVEKRIRGRHLLVEAPEGKNMHDDCVDSAALALWALKGDTFDSGVASLSWGG